MDGLEHYIWKAKHQRGLTDEQIAYFLDRCDRWEFLPHYSLFVKKLGEQGALEEVLRMCGGKAIGYEQLRQRPQNILRKHALFQGMLSDIQRFRDEYPGIFGDDEELLALAAQLQQRMTELEEEFEKE